MRLRTRVGIATGVFAALSLITGCVERGAPTSPFGLWTIEPGDSLSTVRERVRLHGKRGMTCVPGVRPHVHCSTRSEGMPLTGVAGSLQVVADSADAIVLVQFTRDNRYVPPAVRGRVEAEWKQEVSALRASWDSVRNISTRTDRFPGMRVERWLTADSAWSAAIVYQGETDTVLAVTLADERKLAAMRASSPLADHVLGSAMVFPSERNTPEALIAAMMGAQAPASPAVQIGPAPAMEARACDLELADIIVPADSSARFGNDARRTHGEETASTLEKAVPIAYPGWRIVFGRHAYLLSPSGTAEQVHILSERDYHSSGISEGDDIFAFAIKRVRRADSARRRLEDPGSTDRCASRSDILFVRRGGNGEIAESRVVPLDEEALLTDVSQIEFLPGDSRSALGIAYSAWYAGETWTGQLNWLAVVPTDPPRVTSRSPTGFRKVRHGTSADTSAGSVTQLRVIGDTLSFHTLEQVEQRLATQFVRVPLERDRVLRAATLFERIR